MTLRSAEGIILHFADGSQRYGVMLVGIRKELMYSIDNLKDALMKYTHQIINGNVNIEGLLSNNKYLRPATILLALQVAIVGLILLVGALPFAVLLDGGRILKLTLHRQIRNYQLRCYITDVVASVTTDRYVQSRSREILNGML